jgi:hypothetical protein
LFANIALIWLVLGALVVIGHLTWLELRDIRKHRRHRRLTQSGKHMGLVQTVTVVTHTGSTDASPPTPAWTVSNLDNPLERWTTPRSADDWSYRWN